ncbi:MAG TPA: hypothetical protein VL243_04800, partial [Vicinamibacterales bacterium]|nr:hypothetical protein [Vicinamibacterales bacterium]
MKRARVLLAAGLIIASCLAAPPAISWLRGAESLPEALSDQEFWALSSDMSEPGGWFRSDNLLSNELGFPFIVADLVKSGNTSRVYMGVGPEQNFNYIAALKPKMAFVVDIRRGNLDVQLMYKALFELSADRADFVSRLFSKRRPATLNALSTPDQIFQAFAVIGKSEELRNSNLLAVKATLVATHHFALDSEDWKNISDAYSAFYTYGPDIRYSSTQGSGFGGYNQPSYAELMTAVDAEGRPRSYLATEQNYQVLRDLESRNLMVPVVGNFGGPKAIRAVGQYVKEHGSAVSAFYLSNVEMYLNQQNLWEAFCRNVAALPLDPTSTFIRSARGGGYGRGFGLNLTLSEIEPEVKDCR